MFGPDELNPNLQTVLEPVTPRGVAAFARARTWKLWLVQCIVASLNAGALVWVLSSGVFPTIRAAIKNLPPAGDIRNSKLDWRGNAAVLLAEGNILGLTVDLDHSGDIRSPSDFQVEFGSDDVLIRSLLGYMEWPYPAGRWLAFNQPELEPKWGAWEMPVLGIAILAMLAWLFCVWTLLAALYAMPMWLIAFFSNRDLKFIECWRLAGAALMPGAVMMALTLVLYGLGVIDLVALCVVGVGHVTVGWVYLFLCPPFLPRAAAAPRKNPFSTPDGH
jgi:hypothetical protein